MALYKNGSPNGTQMGPELKHGTTFRPKWAPNKMGPQMGPKWAPTNGTRLFLIPPLHILIFPKTHFHFFRGPISSFCNPPYFLEAGFGLIRPRQYGGLKFQPGWQELLPVGDPQRSQTYVCGPLPPGVGGAFIFSYFHK